MPSTGLPAPAARVAAGEPPAALLAGAGLPALLFDEHARASTTLRASTGAIKSRSFINPLSSCTAAAVRRRQQSVAAPRLPLCDGAGRRRGRHGAAGDVERAQVVEQIPALLHRQLV